MLKTRGKYLLQIEIAVHIARNSLVCFDNILDLMFDEIIEGVDMLLDQSLDFQKRRQKIPFVLKRSDSFSI